MIKPLNNNLLIKAKKEQTELGIYMPSVVNNQYEVVAIGKKVMEVKVNDKVIVDTDSMKEIKHGSETYYIISEEKILGIVED